MVSDKMECLLKFSMIKDCLKNKNIKKEYFECWKYDKIKDQIYSYGNKFNL